MKCPCCGHDNLPGVDACERCQSSLTREGLPCAGTPVERSLMREAVACLEPAPALAVEAGTALESALALMREHASGCVLVTRAGKLAGILTERDLLNKCALEALAGCTVDAVMTANPETANRDSPLAWVLQRMVVADLRYLPLVDAAGVATGVLSSRDVIAYIAGRFDPRGAGEDGHPAV